VAEPVSRLAVLFAALRDVWRGASGDYAYEGYCRHLAQHHPETPIPDRADYEKLVQSDRYNGIRRCC
jgi:uncharacterized short protein YbdD (DUF466 family)